MRLVSGARTLPGRIRIHGSRPAPPFLDALDPAHGMVAWVTSALRMPPDRHGFLAIDVVDDGNSREIDCDLGECLAQSGRSRSHQRGMERSADRKRERALGAARLGAFHGAFHRARVPAITNCEGALKFTASQTSAPPPRRTRHGPRRPPSRESRHRALSVRHSFLHRLRAQAHKGRQSANEIAPAATSAVYSPRLCPASSKGFGSAEVEHSLQAQMPA